MISDIYIDGKSVKNEYGLLLASKTISAPSIRTNMIVVPGRDGAIDATDALTGEPTYDTRIISISLFGIKSISGKEWPVAVSDFCNAFHGKKVKVYFPEDSAHYYSGRLSVGEIKLDGGRQLLPVEIICDPWKYKSSETTVTSSDLSPEYKQLSLFNESRPVIPKITVEQDTALLWKENTINASAGSHIFPDIRLTAGENILEAKVSSGNGVISVTYQEASL